MTRKLAKPHPRLAKRGPTRTQAYGLGSNGVAQTRYQPRSPDSGIGKSQPTIKRQSKSGAAKTINSRPTSISDSTINSTPTGLKTAYKSFLRKDNDSVSDRQEMGFQTPNASKPAISALPNVVETLDLPQELGFLLGKYEVLPMPIFSSAKVEQKVRLAIQSLSKKSETMDPQARVLAFRAEAATAGKMITIIEIAKQVLARAQQQSWQYSRLEGVIQQIKAGHGNRLHSGSANDDTEEIVDTAASANFFETMSIPDRTPRPEKIRNMPFLLILLAEVPIPELRKLYGYVQTSTVEQDLRD